MGGGEGLSGLRGGGAEGKLGVGRGLKASVGWGC